MGQVTENDNRNTISISAESCEEADKLFKGLSAGGKVEMPIVGTAGASGFETRHASKSTAVKC